MNNTIVSIPLSPAPKQHLSAAWHAYNRAGLGMFAFILVPQIVSYVLSFVVEFAFPAFFDSVWYVWISQVLCIYMIGAPIALLIIGTPTAAQQVHGKKPLSVWELLAIFCIMETVGLTGSLIGNGLMQLTTVITGGAYTSPVEELLADAPWWIMLLVVGIIGPIVEEFVCRGGVLCRMLPFGEKSAIIFSSLLFGLMHGNFYQLFYAVGLGIILGYVYTRTRSLLYPCLLHVVFNSFSCLQSMIRGAVDVDGMPTDSTDLQAQLDWLSANLLPYLGMMAFTLAILGLALAGFVLLLVLYRRIRFEECPLPLVKQQRVAAWLGNPGMILFFVTSILFIGLTLIPV